MAARLKSAVGKYVPFLLIYPLSADLYQMYKVGWGEQHFYHLESKFKTKSELSLDINRQFIVQEVVEPLIKEEPIKRRTFSSVLSNDACYEDFKVSLKGGNEMLSFFDHDCIFPENMKSEVVSYQQYHANDEICIVYKSVSKNLMEKKELAKKHGKLVSKHTTSIITKK